jgi:hypothetical protein
MAIAAALSGDCAGEQLKTGNLRLAWSLGILEAHNNASSKYLCCARNYDASTRGAGSFMKDSPNRSISMGFRYSLPRLDHIEQRYSSI